MAANQYDYKTTTIKKSENNTPLELQTYTPDNKPFVYEPGANVIDILRQSKDRQAQLVNQEERAKKAAKIAAYTDFFTALGGLAGGGNAPVQQQQPSAYLQRAFSTIDDMRNKQLSYQDYYNKLYDNAVNNDYSRQYKLYSDTKAANDKAGLSAVDAANKAAIEQFRANKTEISEKIDDPRKIEQDIAYKNKQLSIQQQNANANASRAADSRTRTERGDAGVGSTKEPFLRYVPKKGGAPVDLSRSQATQIVNDVLIKHKTLADKAAKDPQLKTFTPLEKETYTDISNISKSFNSDELNKNDNLLRAVAMKYLEADSDNEFGYIYGGQNSIVPVQKPQSVTGSIFSGLSQQRQVSPNYQTAPIKNTPSLLK